MASATKKSQLTRKRKARRAGTKRKRRVRREGTKTLPKLVD